MRSKARQRFFTQYIIKSGLVQQSDLTEVELSGKELEMSIQARNIEGGAYYTQVTGDENNTRLLN